MSDTDTTHWIATVRYADLARRRRTRVEIGDDRAVALFLIGDRVFAFDDVCIHKGRSLARGVVWQGRVVCPAHQWAFEPETGRAEGRDECQPVHDVRIVDGVVHVASRPRSHEEI